MTWVDETDAVASEKGICGTEGPGRDVVKEAGMPLHGGRVQRRMIGGFEDCEDKGAFSHELALVDLRRVVVFSLVFWGEVAIGVAVV